MASSQSALNLAANPMKPFCSFRDKQGQSSLAVPLLDRSNLRRRQFVVQALDDLRLCDAVVNHEVDQREEDAHRFAIIAKIKLTWVNGFVADNSHTIQGLLDFDR